MVDRILLERAHHRIVAAERREPATRERPMPRTPRTSRLGAGEQLVHVRVRVAAIDVAFAVAAGAQLAALRA